ncbi:MAG: MFS transporter, partial [Rhodobacteraceae bacterium]|nr:MFS transporter [Paracoccaceae bacterium]
NNVFVAIGLFACLGFLGGSFPVMIAHGRSFFPPHLVGRGVTLMNLFGIGGIGIMQIMSGRIAEQMADGPPTASYQAIFGLFAAALFVGLVIYLFSRDSLD